VVVVVVVVEEEEEEEEEEERAMEGLLERGWEGRADRLEQKGQVPCFISSLCARHRFQCQANRG
jgi:hypothetical protein